jgi:hypothetical protein
LLILNLLPKPFFSLPPFKGYDLGMKMGVNIFISLPPFCIYFVIFNQTIVMNKKKPRLDLQELVNNKKEFEKLPFLLQKKIFEFFRVSRIYNGKLKKIETLKKKISAEQPLKRKLSKIITEDFNYISNELSIGIPSIYLTPEIKGGAYRVEIDWKGKRKRFTIGKTLVDVKKLCEKYKPNSTKDLSSLNYRDIVKKSLSKIIEKKLTEIGRTKFESLHKIKINSTTLEFEFINPISELDKKKDKVTKKQSTILANNQHSSFAGGGGKVNIGGGSFVKNKNPLGKPTTIDDISKKYKVTAEDSKVKILLMKNKMGGNTKKK